MPSPARLSLPLILAVALLAPAAATAAPTAVSRGEALRALDAAEAALNAPETLSAGGGARNATAALRDLAVALPALAGADRVQARGLLARPTDKGRGNYFGPEAPASPACNGRFCVHWTDRGENAPESARFIDEVVGAVGKAYSIENGELDWRGPKSDRKRGGRRGKGTRGQLDVYITNLRRGLYGYASPDRGQKGARRHAYLVLDNDYVGFPSPPIASMKVTVAHEYNHILQFNYDIFEQLWMLESTATWAEQKVFPRIRDYLNYLPTFARGSRSSLTGRKKVYAESVWNHWLDSRHGPATVRDAWALSLGARPAHFAVAAYGKAIKRHGGRSFSREFAKFAAETAEWNASAAFPDAEDYPDMRRQGALKRRGANLTLDNTAYGLFDVPSGSAKAVKVIARAPHGTRSALALVGRDGNRRSGQIRIASRYLAKGGRGAVRLADPRRYERITAVVINADGRGRPERKPIRYFADGSRYSIELAR